MLVTAESCTGGWAAQAVTSVPGSSDWFERGFVAYSNAAKRELLGVRKSTLDKHGAVSEQTAREMALGALGRSRGTLALAITGVAGPSGGTAAKPVGMVCIGLATRAQGDPSGGGDAVQMRTFNFPGDRDWVRDRAAKMALAMLRFHLLGKPLPF